MWRGAALSRHIPICIFKYNQVWNIWFDKVYQKERHCHPNPARISSYSTGTLQTIWQVVAAWQISNSTKSRTFDVIIFILISIVNNQFASYDYVTAFCIIHIRIILCLPCLSSVWAVAIETSCRWFEMPWHIRCRCNDGSKRSADVSRGCIFVCVCVQLYHIECLVQNCSNSTAIAPELLQPCNKPSILCENQTSLPIMPCLRTHV